MNRPHNLPFVEQDLDDAYALGYWYGGEGDYDEEYALLKIKEFENMRQDDYAIKAVIWWKGCLDGIGDRNNKYK